MAESQVCARAGDAMRGIKTFLIIPAPDNIIGKQTPVGEYGQCLYGIGDNRLNALDVTRWGMDDRIV